MNHVQNLGITNGYQLRVFLGRRLPFQLDNKIYQF
jgi:hypothetical protein